MRKPYEQWRPVVGYEGRYEVSDLGRVRSLANKRRKSELILKQATHVKSGHLLVNLTDTHLDGRWRQTSHYVHALVLTAFSGACPVGLEGCHNDGDPANNALSNLRWDTREGNQADRVTHGTSNRGARNGQAKLDEARAHEIKRRLTAKETQASIAKAMGVSRSAVSAIATGKNWSHL
jgi:DNA-binding XRE family transcriptional regulator